MKNVSMALDKFLILIGMVRFAPDQCLGPRAWLSMFVQLPASGRRRRTARLRTVLRTGAAKSIFGFSSLHERTDPSR